MTTALSQPVTCVLNLLIRSQDENDVLDLLQSRADWMRCATVFDAASVGPDLVLSTTMEKIRGRAARLLVQVLTNPASVPALLAGLRPVLDGKSAQYWVTAVSEAGQF